MGCGSTDLLKSVRACAGGPAVEQRALANPRGLVLPPRMSGLACPLCTMDEVLEHPGRYECVICGHEWDREAEAEPADEARVVKDAHGNVLENGDVVAMVKDLKLKGTSKVLKCGMKSKPIRLVDGDHEIDCRMDGMAIALKACFVKKVTG